MKTDGLPFEKDVSPASPTAAAHTPPAPSFRLVALFRYPGFLPFWVNGLLTSVGMWMEMVAQGWLVVELTGSPFLLGLVAGSQGVAMLVFGALGGVLADRVPRLRTVMAAQVIRAAIAIFIGFLVGTHLIQYWHILLAAVTNGVANALSTPSRQTLTYDLVGRERLANAVALNFVGSDIMRVLGPFIGGMIIATVGMSWCYFLMGASYLSGTIILGRVRLQPRPHSDSKLSLWRNFLEGTRYVKANRTILALLFTEMVADTLAFSHRFMVPLFAKDVLRVGAVGLGMLLSASGLGALLGALAIASFGVSRLKGLLLLGFLFAFGTCLALFSFSRWFPLSLFLLAGAGAMGTAYDTIMGTTLQTSAPDEMRGRVMGTYVLAWGMAPLGGLQAGTVAQFLGAPFAVGLGGTLVALYAVLLAWRLPKLREIS